MSVTAVGADGIGALPSLTDICSLFRSTINDTFSGGEGMIATNDAPFMRPFLNAAVRDLYADLRLVGDPIVVRDNYILTGIPALAVADPATQTRLTYAGYFDGVQMHSKWALPSDFLSLRKLWQRTTNAGTVFFPVQNAAAGIAGEYQGSGLTAYEVRSGAELWLSGATGQLDLRLRYNSVFPNLVSDSNVDFDNTYLPIPDSTNAAAQKMVALYAQRMSPEQFPLAEAQAGKFTNKLRQESIRNSQTKEYVRIEFDAC